MTASATNDPLSSACACCGNGKLAQSVESEPMKQRRSIQHFCSDSGISNEHSCRQLQSVAKTALRIGDRPFASASEVGNAKSGPSCRRGCSDSPISGAAPAQHRPKSLPVKKMPEAKSLQEASQLPVAASNELSVTKQLLAVGEPLHVLIHPQSSAPTGTSPSSSAALTQTPNLDQNVSAHKSASGAIGGLRPYYAAPTIMPNFPTHAAADATCKGKGEPCDFICCTKGQQLAALQKYCVSQTTDSGSTQPRRTEFSLSAQNLLPTSEELNRRDGDMNEDISCRNEKSLNESCDNHIPGSCGSSCTPCVKGAAWTSRKARIALRPLP